MALDEYRRKRDFTRTPEPSGDAAATPRRSGRGRRAEGFPGWNRLPRGRRFCVQMHRATRLHWDLRLEHRGVLLSWAVTRGPSMDPSVRRLAVQTEDHPLDYGDFEGVIPTGYGMGTVELWDAGRMEFEHPDAAAVDAALREGNLKFVLHGVKLRGRFALVRTRGRDGDERNWLLIHKRGEGDISGDDALQHDVSVLTGRTLDEIAADEGGDPRAKRRQVTARRTAPAKAPAPRRAESPQAADPRALVAAAPRGAPPQTMRPMMAVTVERPFSRDGWAYEVKYDGVRALVTVDGGDVRLRSRRGRDETRRYPELQAVAGQVDAASAVLDGEIVAVDGSGTPSFELLQQRVNCSRAADIVRAAERVPVSLVLFDALFVDGHDLRGLPLRDRKAILRALLRDSAGISYADHVETDGERLFAAVRDRGLEGVVAKQLDSRYEAGRRSRCWVKIKSWQSQEVVICGWLDERGHAGRAGALLTAVRDGGELVYAGRVGSGLSAAAGDGLPGLLRPVRSAPLARRPSDLPQGVHWVEPQLVCEVRFAGWTDAGVMRHPGFRRLRPELAPADCVRERALRLDDVLGSAPAGAPPQTPAPPARIATPRRARGGRTAPPGIVLPDPAHAEALERLAGLRANDEWEIGGRRLRLTNLDKAFWPEDGITKRDLVAHYVRMAPVLLPYLRDRPLSMHMYPDGIHGTHFWRKDKPDYAPRWMRSWVYHGDERVKNYIVVDEVATLAWVANHGVIDLHPWHSRVDAPDQPDWVVFDLDPFEPATFADVITIAKLCRAAIDHYGLRSVLKTSGQTGLQIYVPIRRGPDYDTARGWVEDVARAIGKVAPELVTFEWAVRRRTGQIRIDYTQNIINKTLAAPYAVRPEAGAPVSAPISWDELDDPQLRPNRWSIRSIAERVAEAGDLFAPVLEQDQDLPPVE